LVRPTDIEVFRRQLEALGCDVEGLLASAAAKEKAEAEAANGSGRRQQRRDSSTSRGSSGRGTRGSAQRPVRGPLLSSASWDADATSSFSEDDHPGVANGNGGASCYGHGGDSRGAASWTSRRSSHMSGPAVGLSSADVEDEEVSSRGAAPDFAVWVDSTQQLHRVGWNQGVTVAVEGKALHQACAAAVKSWCVS
jgi:hypothetical protein